MRSSLVLVGRANVVLAWPSINLAIIYYSEQMLVISSKDLVIKTFIFSLLKDSHF